MLPYEQDAQRRRLALLLMIGGAVAVISGLVVIFHFPHEMSTIERVVAPTTSADHRTAAQVIAQVLFWLVILTGIFAVGTFAFLRWSRHYRRRLLRKPRPPTPSDDVWAMHRLPPDAESKATSE